jgi:large subunit ribosomal protein L13
MRREMVTRLRSYNPSQAELTAAWHVIDADGKILGRLATDIAMKLMGKNKPGYVPHLLAGDFVVVTNAAKVKVTGKKADQIVYVRHNQYPGHRKEVPYAKEIANHPTRVIKHAVKGMLPKSKLGTQMLTRLKVYAGPEHPHSAQVLGRRPQEQSKQSTPGSQPATGGA